MRQALKVSVIILGMWGQAALADWPKLAGTPPLSGVIETTPQRQHSERGRPNAFLHGPEGLSDIPFIDRKAHQETGRSTKRFPRPAFDGQRVDWCSAPNFECGPSAAQHFCEATGYHRVVEVVQERDVGLYAHTRQIATGLLCAGPGCHGFLRITCSKG